MTALEVFKRVESGEWEEGSKMRRELTRLKPIADCSSLYESTTGGALGPKPSACRSHVRGCRHRF
jgi:hypothetical protein